MKVLGLSKELLRNRWIETSLALTAIVVISAYGITEFPIVKDMGFFSYIGQEMLRGYKPYSTVYEIKPPALFYFYAFAMSVFGFLPQYMSIRVFMLGVIAASVVMLYRIVLKSTGGARVAALSSIIFMSFVYSMELALLGDSKAVAISLSFLTILLAYRHNYALSGAVASLACLFWQPFGLFIFAPLSMAALDGNLKPFRIGVFLKTAAGFSAPMAMLVLYFTWLGLLPDLVNFSLLYPLKYESSTIFNNMLWKIAMFTAAFSTEFFFIAAAGLGALHAAYAVAAETSRGRIMVLAREKKYLVVFALPFVLMSGIFVKDFAGASTLTVVLPLVSVLAAMTIESFRVRLADMLSGRMPLSGSRVEGLSTALVVLAVCAYGFLPALQPIYPESPIITERWSYIGEPTPIAFLRSMIDKYGIVDFVKIFLFRRPGEQVTIGQQLELASVIRDGTSEGELILSLDEPEILFLAGRRNMNQYPLYEGTGFYELSVERGELAGIVADVVSYRPKFILYNDRRFITKLGLDDFISDNYVQNDLLVYHVYKLRTS